jgi:hypothetical protein
MRGCSSSPSKVKNFHFSISSKPVLGSTQPPFQCVPGAISPGVKRQGREKLTTHFQLVSKSRKRRYIHPLPQTPSWRSV